MAKPTGINGFFRSQVNEDGSIAGEFVKTNLSPSKIAAERQIVDGFFDSMNKHLGAEKFMLGDPRANDESDFDLTISSPNGPAYLELMEIAPLAGPYSTAPANYRPYSFASSILGGILNKSDRYPRRLQRDLYLLLYVTHWAFTLSASTIACLRYWLRTKPTVFRAIFFYQPLDNQEGAPHWLFPVPAEMLGDFIPELIRDNVVANLNPETVRVIKPS